ncbi:MAG TPA: glycoside hydrolase family 3 N-terminal domain-containing protein, partial [Leptospiraceae bacterium]|nr:glycoside hydrolase family 3 N-terminal domain-containing protein [Leptospiraceae bacterium]
MRHLIFLIAAAGVSCARLFSNPIDDLAKTAPAELVKQMTLEEKVGQLIHIGMAGKAMNPALKADIEKYHVGGVILFEINLGKGPEIKAL